MKWLWLVIVCAWLIVGFVQTNATLSVFAAVVAVFFLIVHYGERRK